MGELVGQGGPKITGVLELAPDEVTDLDGGFVHVGWTDRFPIEIGEPVDPGLVFGATLKEEAEHIDPLVELHNLVEEARAGMERAREELCQLQPSVVTTTPEV